MNNHIVLISKDTLLPEYLEPYGGLYWKTPNIQELALKGTIFMRHYTSAPSTAMSFTSMFTGLYPYQLERSNYTEVDGFTNSITLFDALEKRGYKCHLFWSKNYINMAEKFSKCFGKNTIHHEKFSFNQPAGPNVPLSEEGIKPNENTALNTYNLVIDEIDIIDRTKPIFLWLHLPHCLLGRAGYGQDIDLFDKVVGALRLRFGDESIFITADHGHMNGKKSKVCYGFDVYEEAINIPLITPRINNIKKIEYPTSNTQLIKIILDRNIEKKEYVLSDSAYYAQAHRKLSVIKDRYKYIYNKQTKMEELYDLQWDPDENNNILERFVYDNDRHCVIDKRQVVFYPFETNALKMYKDLQTVKDSIWRNGSFLLETKYKLIMIKIRIIQKIKRKLKKINQNKLIKV